MSADHAVLILAAGDSKRWAGWPKQLAPLWDGETVLSRMIRQVRAHALEPIIVARAPVILEAGSTRTFDPGPTTSVFESALLTKELWGEYTAILLGDVVFTETIIAEVLWPVAELRIFTNPRETYAFSFDRAVSDQIEIALRNEAIIAQNGGKGSLRGMRDQVKPSSWIIVRDLTDDIDSPEKYELLLARWGKLEAVR